MAKDPRWLTNARKVGKQLADEYQRLGKDSETTVGLLDALYAGQKQIEILIRRVQGHEKHEQMFTNREAAVNDQ
jgi:hypothetical protein